jgi:hypothetical protein
MYRHGPSCLEGPVSKQRGWWAGIDLPIRAELVERVRREIAAGLYDTPEKWAIALERLLQRLDDDR